MGAMIMIGRLHDYVYEGDVPKWIAVADAELGVKEKRGGENPRIIEYHQTTSLKATEDEVPWCSAFVNWVMLQCGLEGTGSAAARGWLGYGPRMHEYQQFAIVVLKRGKTSWEGHVGFAIDADDEQICVLGGNQNDSVSYAWYPRKDVLGYFWPRAPKNSAPMYLS